MKAVVNSKGNVEHGHLSIELDYHTLVFVTTKPHAVDVGLHGDGSPAVELDADQLRTIGNYCLERAARLAPPCPHCNDEGVVSAMDGSLIGPCDCGQPRWDIGAPEPAGITEVKSLEFDDTDCVPLRFGRTTRGEWKGYIEGGKVYYSWPELVRRFGPVAPT